MEVQQNQLYYNYYLGAFVSVGYSIADIINNTIYNNSAIAYGG